MVEISSLETIIELEPRGQTNGIWIVKDPHGDYYLLKIYNDSALKGINIGALRSLIQWRQDLSKQDRDFLDEHAAWPRELVYDGRDFIGTMIQVAPEVFWRIKNGEREPRGGSAATSTLKNGEFFNHANRLRIMGSLLSVILWFHEHDVVVGDIHLGNYLIGSDGSVMLIDMDSVWLGGTHAFSFTENLSYAAPFDKKGIFTKRTDLYKYALVAIRTISQNASALKLNCCSDLVAVDQAEILDDWLNGRSVNGGLSKLLAEEWIGCVDKKSGREYIYTNKSALKTLSNEQRSRIRAATLPFGTHTRTLNNAGPGVTEPPPKSIHHAYSRPYNTDRRRMALWPDKTTSEAKPRRTSSRTRIAVTIFILILILTFIAFVFLGNRIPGKLGDFATDLRSRIEKIISNEKTVTSTTTSLTHVTDLQIGDCYNEPDAANATTNDDGSRQVNTVEVVDCEVSPPARGLQQLPDHPTLSRTRTPWRDPIPRALREGARGNPTSCIDPGIGAPGPAQTTFRRAKPGSGRSHRSSRTHPTTDRGGPVPAGEEGAIHHENRSPRATPSIVSSGPIQSPGESIHQKP